MSKFTLRLRRLRIKRPEHLLAPYKEDGSFPEEPAGLAYFLEVAVALEAATVSRAGTRFERVVHYAENDAFLFDG